MFNKIYFAEKIEIKTNQFNSDKACQLLSLEKNPSDSG